MTNWQRNRPTLWKDALPHPAPDGHKYDRGHAMILGGDIATGAARLAARTALRIGAGLVSVLCSKAAFPIYASALEAVMVKPERKKLASHLQDSRINSWCAGPGLGNAPDIRREVTQILQAKRPTLLDADALNAFSEQPDTLLDLLHNQAILTPHSGEFERLFGQRTANIEEKIAITCAAANRAGCLIVHKGAQTVIAAPEGKLAVNEHASPFLATAGSGDVLAGLIAGLSAQSMPAFEAACAACWLHGEAARQLGAGLIAEDLPDALPALLHNFFQ